MSGQVVVASYERVSTFAQAQHGFSLGAQAQDIDAFVAANGWVLPDHLRFRDGETQNASGADWNLPGLNAMMAAAKRGEFQILVTPDFDRFARNMTKSLVLESELQRDGVKVIFMRVPLEDTAEGRLLKNQLMAFAEYEREKFRIRATRGRRAKAERGLVVGSGMAPYGYRYIVGDRNQRVGLEPDPETAPVAIRILNDLLTQSSIDVAAALQAEGAPPPIPTSQWHPTTLTRMAHRTVYKGQLRYSRENPIFIPVPALIDEHRWNALQKAIDGRRLRNRRGQRPVEEDPFILRGRMTCGCCGGAMAVKTNGEHRYYLCLRSSPRAAERMGRDQCVFPRLPAQALEDRLWSIVSATLLDPAALEAGLEASVEHGHAAGRERRERLEIIETAIAEEEARIARQAARLRDVDPGTAVEAAIFQDMQTIETKVGRFRGERDALLTVAPVGLTPDIAGTIREFAGRVTTGLERATFAERRRMIEILRITGVVRPGDENAPKVGRHRVDARWEAVISLDHNETQFLIPVDDRQKRIVVGTWQDQESWERWHTTESFQRTRDQLNGATTDDGNERWYEVVVEA